MSYTVASGGGVVSQHVTSPPLTNMCKPIVDLEVQPLTVYGVQ